MIIAIITNCHSYFLVFFLSFKWLMNLLDNSKFYSIFIINFAHSLNQLFFNVLFCRFFICGNKNFRTYWLSVNSCLQGFRFLDAHCLQIMAKIKHSQIFGDLQFLQVFMWSQVLWYGRLYIEINKYNVHCFVNIF